MDNSDQINDNSPIPKTTFWQLNLNKSKAATAHLRHKLSNFPSQFIGFLQEPYTYKGKACYLDPQGLELHQVTGTRDSVTGKLLGPRAIIVSTHSTELVMLPMSTRDCTACLWHPNRKSTVVIASIYMDITKDVITEELKEVVKFAKEKKYPLIIACDSNAHAHLWGMVQSNPRGETLEDFILQENLVVCNIGTKNTYEAPTGSSIIDLTLTNTDLFYEINSWKVCEEDTLSDHKLIEFTMNDTHEFDTPKTFRYEKADWQKFADILDTSCKEWHHPLTWNKYRLEQHYTHFLKDVKQAMRKAIPYLPQNKLLKIPEFWDQELLTAKKQAKKAWKKWRLDVSDQVRHLAYSEARKSYQKLLKSKRRTFKDGLLNKVDSVKTMAKLTKLIQGKENQKLGLLEDNEGKATTSIQDTLGLLFKTHFPNSERASDQLNKKKWEKLDPAEPMTFIDEEIMQVVTCYKVKKAFAKFGDDKTAGPDEIKPVVLKHFPASALGRITVLYRASLQLGYMPQSWRLSTAIFIPKPGKESYSKPKSFRPISLAPFLLKGLERVVAWYLEETMLKKNPLSKWQHGFKRDKNTNTAILSVIDELESGVLRKGYGAVVLLDIEGAFDNLQPDHAIEAYREKGAPEWFLKWYAPYLKERYIVTRYKGVTCYRRLRQAAPQGGVLSTMTWNVSYDSLLIIINNSTAVLAIGFADDASLSKTGRVLEQVLNDLQKGIDMALEWGQKHGLRFNPAKTEVILCTNKHLVEPPFHLKMGDVPLRYTQQARYLGVTLDHKLSWKPHVMSKIMAAKQKISQLHNLISKVEGPSVRMREWAYKGVILPALTYASCAWVQKLENSTLQNELRKLNRKAMTMAIPKVYTTTPTRSMEIILNLPPLHLEIRRHARNAFLQIEMPPSKWDGITDLQTMGTLKYLERLSGKDISKKEQCRQRTRELFTLKRFLIIDKSVIPPQAIKCTFSVLRAQQNVAYWQIRGRDLNRDDYLLLPKDQRQTTCFLLALASCLTWLLERSPPGIDICILVEKRIYLHCIEIYESRDKYAQEIWKLLNELAQEHQVYFAEFGTYQKLRVRPREAIELGKQVSLGVEPGAGFDLALLKRSNIDWMIRQWNFEWDQYDEALRTKCFIKTFEPTNICRDWSHQTVAKVIQLITGHGPFRHHFRHWNPPEWDTDCRLCLEAEENAIHLIAECPALNWARNETLRDWTKALKQPPATPNKPKKKKFLAKAKRWKNLSIHRGKQPLISNYYEACTNPDVALGNDLNNPTHTDNSEEEDDPQLSTEPSCTPPRRGTGNPNANTEQPSGNTQESTVNSCIPVREGSGDPKSEDIPCLGDITMIMDSLREFVIDTDPLRDLFSQPVA